jgi:hypothetical protein
MKENTLSLRVLEYVHSRWLVFVNSVNLKPYWHKATF